MSDNFKLLFILLAGAAAFIVLSRYVRTNGGATMITPKGDIYDIGPAHLIANNPWPYSPNITALPTRTVGQVGQVEQPNKICGCN